MKTKKTKYLLIGSGVAAVTLTERLLEKHREASIILLEAGKKYPSKDRRSWWNYMMTGKAVYSPGEDQDRDLKTEFDIESNVNWDAANNRVLAYGGSTLHWGGWALRLKPEDFHLYGNTGRGADWPFGYETLHDYYYQAEQRLSVCGDIYESWNNRRLELKDAAGKIRRPGQPYPLPPFEWTAADGEMIEAFRQLGIEPGRLPIARFRKCMATGTCKYCPIGGRYTAQDALEELHPRNLFATPDDERIRRDCEGDSPYPNLFIGQRCAVMQIVMNGRTAANVTYLDVDRLETGTIEAETVVVCAGAYESPKILLQSTSDFWPQGVGNQHDQVGRHLVSHSILRALGETSPNKECWIQEYDFPTLMSRTYDTPEYQRHGKLFLFKNRKLPHLHFPDSMAGGLSKVQIENKLRGSRRMELQAFLEEKGRPENYVALGIGKTSKFLPKTKIVFSRTDAEKADSLSRLELLERVIRQMDYKILECEVDRPGGHHATGTCRMSRTPETGVVDENLLVHGTTNVYVCSNAAMPTGAAVNPTLTLTALSMRLADHLAVLHGPAAERRAEPAEMPA